MNQAIAGPKTYPLYVYVDQILFTDIKIMHDIFKSISHVKYLANFGTFSHFTPALAKGTSADDAHSNA